MEYKFKTNYKEKLVDCYIFGNDIYIRQTCGECSDMIVSGLRIGVVKEVKNINEPVLPILQYIGKKDCDGDEIYCGFILNYENYFAEVVWDDERAAFDLEIKYYIGQPSISYREFIINNGMLCLDKFKIMYPACSGLTKGKI